MEWPIIEQIYRSLAKTTRLLLTRDPKQVFSTDTLEDVVNLLQPIKPINAIEQTAFFILRYCFGILVLAERQWDKAVAIFSSLLAEKPTNPMVLFFNAEIAFQAGQYELAQCYITKAIALAPHSLLFAWNQHKILQACYLQAPRNDPKQLLIKKQIEALQLSLRKVPEYNVDTLLPLLAIKEFKKAVLTVDYFLSYLIQQTIIDRLESCIQSQLKINKLLGENIPEVIAFMQYLDLTLKSHKAFLCIHKLCYKDIIQPYDNSNLDTSFLKVLSIMEIRRNDTQVFAAQIGNLAADLEQTVSHFSSSFINQQSFENNTHNYVRRNSFWNTSVVSVSNPTSDHAEEEVQPIDVTQTTTSTIFQLI